MVGRARVELATSRLSGVRSNHLSYRPIRTCPADQMAAGRESLLRLTLHEAGYPLMKGHEDGGNVLWNGGSSSEWQTIRRFPPISLERR